MGSFTFKDYLRKTVHIGILFAFIAPIIAVSSFTANQDLTDFLVEGSYIRAYLLALVIYFIPGFIVIEITLAMLFPVYLLYLEWRGEE